MDIVGTVKKIIYRNDGNGFTVMEFCDDDNKNITAAGIIPTVSTGERVMLSGDWISHKVYGPQFKINGSKPLTPSTLIAVINYLSSGLISGVGEATAKAIVTAFGMDTLDVLENSPQRLMEIPGIGKLRAEKISASYAAQREMRDIMIELQKYNITVLQSIKLYRLYGRLCITKINENPYRLIDDVEGIGFKTADKIASHAGFESDSPFRICAGIKYTLQWAKNEGHTYLPLEKLTEVAADILGTDIVPVEDNIMELIRSGKLANAELNGETAVFLPDMKLKESECARLLTILNKKNPQTYFTSATADVEKLERHFDINLAKEQKKAVISALSNGVSVITGGPGTGKTTILRFIIEILNQRGIEYELCAPTGRAAKRMTEATGVEAQTIHRLLEYGGGEGFVKSEENPIESEAFIIDEMSMVDVPLFYALLKAMPSNAQLIMVGDADQLPPVGAGNVLRDIIASDVVSVVRLTDVFRQAERGMIVENAHLINSGCMPNLDNEEADFRFDEIQSAADAVKRTLTLCEGKSKLILSSDPHRDIQVLAPMKKGALGVHNLNVCLQATLNPPMKGKSEHKRGETLFREGDKVMQIRNNYRIPWVRKKHAKIAEEGAGIFNGDMGTVVRIDSEYHTLDVLYDDERLVSYDFATLEELELAYCISIHKSQGSEFPIVLLPLLGGTPKLLTRNLLYTAVTRAREQVYIIGSRDCIRAMTDNADVKKRYSALSTFIQELAPFERR